MDESQGVIRSIEAVTSSVKGRIGGEKTAESCSSMISGHRLVLQIRGKRFIIGAFSIPCAFRKSEKEGFGVMQWGQVLKKMASVQCHYLFQAFRKDGVFLVFLIW